MGVEVGVGAGVGASVGAAGVEGAVGAVVGVKSTPGGQTSTNHEHQSLPKQAISQSPSTSSMSPEPNSGFSI